MKVRIVKYDVNWLEIKNLCRTTVNKQDSRIMPTDEWKKKLLLSEHSPLRHSNITIELTVPYFVMGHLVRHNVGITPYVGTSRSDRTGIDRNERKQTDEVTMRMDLNVQSLINISRKRLCFQASKETREVWEEVIRQIYQIDPVVAEACVPECIRDNGCPEFYPCGYYDRLANQIELNSNIGERYTNYNKKRILKRG